MLEHLLNKYPESRKYAMDIKMRFKSNRVIEYIDYYPEKILSNEKKKLIRNYLLGKYDILTAAVNGVE